MSEVGKSIVATFSELSFIQVLRYLLDILKLSACSVAMLSKYIEPNRGSI